MHYKLIPYFIVLLNIFKYCSSLYTFLPNNCRASYHDRMYRVNDQMYSKSFKLYTTDLNQQNSMNINNITKIMNDFSNIKDISEPLLDMELIKKTIIQWTTPLPTSYISRPMVIVGPSGVGKGRLIKALLKDYNRFFQKVVTHTTRYL